MFMERIYPSVSLQPWPDQPCRGPSGVPGIPGPRGPDGTTGRMVKSHNSAGRGTSDNGPHKPARNQR